MSQINTPSILKLGETRAWRTYLGGIKLEQFRGRTSKEPTNFPEDWIASTVRAKNPGREDIIEGLSEVINLKTKIYLKEVLEQKAQEYLGSSHVKQLNNELGMLIKLIDSSERLTIQVHPNKEIAKSHFNSEFGKTEAWHILDAKEINGQEPCIYFGFKPHVTREIFKEIFEKQDIPAMLDCLHKVPVKAGDSFFIPGGLPHAIGAGCFLAEIQEPTDYTIRTEKTTPSGLKIHDSLCHQGLGFERMFDCFDFNGETLEKTLDKWKIKSEVILQKGKSEVLSIFDKRKTDLFQMNFIKVDKIMSYNIQDRLRVWIILNGNGTLKASNQEIKMEKGDYLLLPYSLGECSISCEEKLDIIECLPKQFNSK